MGDPVTANAMTPPDDVASREAAPNAALRSGRQSGSPGAFLHPFAKPGAPASSFITIVRGHGSRVWDDTGREYVDGLASLWYCNIGHGRGEVADAVADQLRTLGGYHCFDRFTNAPADQLAERLAALAPVAGSRVFLTSGGSEAVDTAVKLARLAQARAGHPERTVVISRVPSYHGVTYGAMTLTGLPLNRDCFGPGIGDVVQTPKDDLDAVRAVFEQQPGRVAAVIAEPVVGAGGVHPAVPGYLAGLRALCDEHGAYLISDEVICAFGRLGAMFTAELTGVMPDLVTFAKGVTSGYLPLGGVLVAPSVHEPLSSDPAFVLRHGYTYSGHPSAATAALTTLDITEREDLPGRADRICGRLSAGLGRLVDTGALAGARGQGALWAAVVHPDVDVIAVRDAMLERGAIVRPLAPDAIAFCPPLVITDEEIDGLLDSLAGALGEAYR